MLRRGEIVAADRSPRPARIGARDRLILAGLAAGIKQAEIARELGVTRAEVCRRVRRLRALVDPPPPSGTD